MRVSRLPVGLVALAAALVLFPHRGDSRTAPVTHPEWARLVLRGLDLEEALEHADTPPRVFAVLSWRQSEWLDATRLLPRSERGVLLEPGTPPVLRASAAVGEASFPVSVARAGEYGVRVLLAGEREATVEVVPLRGGETRTATVAPAPTRGWIEAPRPLRLHPGAYRATLSLPRGCVFERLELVPRCIAPIEPIGGWVAGDDVDAEDLAVTLVRALDRERELPPADAPIDAAGSEFVAPDGKRPAGARLAGGTGGGRATVTMDAPVDGLYTLSAFGVRTAGQRWAVDGCRTAVTCPLPSRLPSWSAVTTLPLSAGRHRFTVDLGPGDSVDRVRLERRKDGGADYVDAVRRMGFDPGTGAVSQARADEAKEWLRRRHRIELGETCWEPGGPARPRVALRPPGWEEPLTEPPATPPCQPPSSPVVPDPCPAR